MAVSRRAVAVVVATATSVLAGPVLAHAAWRPVDTLSAPGVDAVDVQTGVDGARNTISTWTRGDDVQARVRRPDGTLQPTITLSDSYVRGSAAHPQIAVDEVGDAVFVWEEQNPPRACWVIRARMRAADGTLGPVMSAYTNSAYDCFSGRAPRVGIDAVGNAVIVFERHGADVRILARTLSAGSVLGPTLFLSTAGADASKPDVGVDADGDAVFAWQKSDGTHTRIQERALAAAGTLSVTRTNSAAGGDATAARVAVDPDGDSVATWQRLDGARSRIQARFRWSADAYGAVATLSDAAHDAVAPAIGIDPGGNAVLAWQLGGTGIVQVRRRTASGLWSSVADVTTDGRPAGVPSVAVDASGTALIAYPHQDATGFLRAEARTRAPSGALGPAQTLSSAGAQVQPAVAIDVNRNGNAAAAWSRLDPAAYRVEASVGP